MAFEIDIMKCTNEKNKMTKIPTSIAKVSGTLRNETSIINPTILIEGDVSSLKNANYMHIAEFGRYYYITDITSIRNGLYQVTGHCDVLFTYKSQILSNSAIIKRQEKDWNLYLNDGSFTINQNPHIITKEFSSGFSLVPTFVLAVAGKG